MSDVTTATAATRTGDIDGSDQIVGTQFRGDLLGEIARFYPGLLGKHHGGIRSHVAMGGIARRIAGRRGSAPGSAACYSTRP